MGILALALACAGTRDGGGGGIDAVEVLGVPGGDDGALAALWSGEVQTFHLALGPDAREALADDPSTDVPAVFTWEGTSLPAGVHLKGHWSFRDLDGKASFKVDFGAFDAAGRLHGLRRLTLDNMVQDPSMLQERAAYALYDAAGAFAPRHGYAWLAVDGEPYGLYSLVETVDGDFLEARWPDDRDGWLYETDNGAGDVTRGGADGFVVQEEGPGEAGADLEDLAAALDEAEEDDRLLDALEASFDADALFAALAVDLATGHADGYTFATNNYLLYHAPLADRWALIPWGQDQAFAAGLDVRTPAKGRLVADCRAEPACADRLEATIGDVLDAWERSGFLDDMAAAAEIVAPFCEEDPRREDPCLQQELLDVLARRPGDVRDQLD